MRLLVKNSRSKIVDCIGSLQERLVETFSFIDPDSGLPLTIYDTDSDTFPTGLTPEAIRIANDNGTPLEVEDLRERPESLDPLRYQAPPLRPEYQTPDLQRMLATVRGVVKWPTGAGKTLLTCHYIAQRGILPVVFYVNRASLMSQTADVFREAFGEELIGVVGDGVCNIRPITVAMVQSTSFGLKKGDPAIEGMVKAARVILVDECQHTPASTLLQVVRQSTLAYHRFGLSATPFRSDGLDIMITAALGPRIVERTASELSRLGYLVNAHIRFREVPPVRYRPGLELWHKAYNELIVHNHARNDLILTDVQELYETERRIAVFVNQLNHGRLLTKLFRERLPSQEIAFVEGEMSIDFRRLIFDRIREGTIRVMVITPLGDEGLDLPPIDAIVLADGGRSPVEKIQQIGRGLRPWPGKQNCQIRDYLDDGPIVGKHAQERLRLFSTYEEDWQVHLMVRNTRSVNARVSSGRDETW